MNSWPRMSEQEPKPAELDDLSPMKGRAWWMDLRGCRRDKWLWHKSVLWREVLNMVKCDELSLNPADLVV